MFLSGSASFFLFMDIIILSKFPACTFCSDFNKQATLCLMYCTSQQQQPLKYMGWGIFLHCHEKYNDPCPIFQKNLYTVGPISDCLSRGWEQQLTTTLFHASIDGPSNRFSLANETGNCELHGGRVCYGSVAVPQIHSEVAELSAMTPHHILHDAASLFLDHICCKEHLTHSFRKTELYVYICTHI